MCYWLNCPELLYYECWGGNDNQPNAKAADDVACSWCCRKTIYIVCVVFKGVGCYRFITHPRFDLFRRCRTTCRVFLDNNGPVGLMSNRRRYVDLCNVDAVFEFAFSFLFLSRELHTKSISMLRWGGALSRISHLPCIRHLVLDVPMWTWMDPVFTEWPWWRRQMKRFSVLLALCEGNPTITGGFPSQRPVTRIFDVFWTNGWPNSREAGDLRRHGTHYDLLLQDVLMRRFVKKYIFPLLNPLLHAKGCCKFHYKAVQK